MLTHSRPVFVICKLTQSRCASCVYYLWQAELWIVLADLLELGTRRNFDLEALEVALGPVGRRSRKSDWLEELLVIKLRLLISH